MWEESLAYWYEQIPFLGLSNLVPPGGGGRELRQVIEVG